MMGSLDDEIPTLGLNKILTMFVETATSNGCLSPDGAMTLNPKPFWHNSTVVISTFVFK